MKHCFAIVLGIVLTAAAVPFSGRADSLRSIDDIRALRNEEVRKECGSLAEFYSNTLVRMNHCVSKEDCIALGVKNSYACHQLVNKEFVNFSDTIYRWDRALYELCGQQIHYPRCLFSVKMAADIECRDGKCECASDGCRWPTAYSGSNDAE